MSSSPNKKRSAGKIALIVLCIILALILILLITASVMINRLLGRIGRFEDPTQLNSSTQNTLPVDDDIDPSTPNDVIIPTSSAEIIPSSENVISILLVGQDRREGQGRQRSDAMILCTINKENKTLTMTSFMRDLYVYIPGCYNDRLNVAYKEGGFELLNQTLAHNFGVQADHCVEVDFDGFRQAIDAVGGVDITLTQKEAEYLNVPGKWNDGTASSTKLKEGLNHMNGEQALAYSRLRSIGSDFARTNRQRTVLMALVEKIGGMNLVQLYALADSLIPMVTTDLTDQEIIRYMAELVPLVSELEIISQRVPENGMYSPQEINGADVLVPDLPKIQEFLVDTLGN